jgi:membrane-bound metal-dependent hydrolase YbcI (DUF457 family)
MKGKNHLKMGAATVGIVSAVGLVPYTEAPAAVAAGVGLFLFAKVSPDLDHPSSSVTRSWGPITWLLSRAIIRPAARMVYRMTRSSADPETASPHRGFTHTMPGALVAGLILGWAVLSGPVYAAVTLGLCWGAAAYVYDRGWVGYAGAGGGAVGWFAWPELVAAVPWLATVIVIGCFAHAVDDCVTTQGAPLRFPFKNEKGKRWARVGPPEWMRFDTGSGMETAVVWAALIGATGALYWFLVQPVVGPWLVERMT